ncbi:MAG TPA: ABC transporter permease [Blastocatellia bacterium]|nr:ABC transporter permease [Blastocatellia bacterium]
MLGNLRTLLRALLRRSEMERELDEELRRHIEQQTEQNIRLGMNQDEARYKALKDFGGVEQAKERIRDARGVKWIEELRQDLRYGARISLKHRGVTLVAVLTLALGIGANTAIFSVVYGVLLKPLPYRDPDRIVTVTLSFPERGIEFLRGGDYLDWREQSQSFEQLAGFYIASANLTGDGEAERLTFGRASAGFFPLLGVEPLLGRNFHLEEDQAGGQRVVLLSQELWRRRFGSDPNIIGKTVTLDGAGFLIVGVMASGIRFPGEEKLSGLFSRQRAVSVDAWAPLALNATEETSRKRYELISVIGRLKPFVTTDQAQGDLEVITRRIEQAHPGMYAGAQVRVSGLSEETVKDARLALRALWGAVTFVLLIVCSNVANLLFARTVARRKELAVRAALGAGRARFIRQLLTESAILSVLGGSLGLLLAWGGVRWLVSLDPDWIPRAKELGINGAALSFTCLISILSAVIAGLPPALLASRTDLNEELKGGSGAKSSSRGGWRLARPTLVVAELALTLALLIGAGLMIKSFLRLRGVDKGFQSGNVLTMTIRLSPTKYPPGSARGIAYCQDLLARLQTLPGVRSAALTTWLPLTGVTGRGVINIEGRPRWESGKAPVVEFNTVSADYFRTMGMQIRAGRAFNADDRADAPRAVIINETLARRFFPGENPLGKRLDSFDPQAPWAAIVGVIADVKHLGLDEEVKPEIHFPFPQTPVYTDPIIAVGAAIDPIRMAAALRNEVAAVDPSQPVYEVMTMEQRLDNSMALRRNGALLFGLFAAVALIIAAVGVYGVISYSVSQRTHEIGIRMALGAHAGAVRTMILRQGLSLIFLGVAIGLAGATAATRAMTSLLFDVSGADPLTFIAVALLLTMVALLACYIPARRATRVDPILALRSE